MKITKTILKKYYSIYKHEDSYLLTSLTEKGKISPFKYLCQIFETDNGYKVGSFEPTNDIDVLNKNIDVHVKELPYNSEYYFPLSSSMISYKLNPVDDIPYKPLHWSIYYDDFDDYYATKLEQALRPLNFHPFLVTKFACLLYKMNMVNDLYEGVLNDSYYVNICCDNLYHSGVDGQFGDLTLAEKLISLGIIHKTDVVDFRSGRLYELSIIDATLDGSDLHIYYGII